MQTQRHHKKRLVSFCCLSYNHELYIDYCLNSIIQQKYSNIEIIILDDGSQDKSAEKLKAYARIYSSIPIKIFLQKNTGNIAKNFNTLLNHACGEYVTFISMDDYVEKDCISSKIEFLESNQNMSFVANKLNNRVDQNNKCIFANESCVDWSRETCYNTKDLLEIEFKYIGAFYIQGALFRRNLIDKVGGFDADLLGDDIILRTKILLYMIKNPNLEFKLLNQSAVNYRLHDKNISKNLFRQILVVKEWKDRYFAESLYPRVFLEWLSCAIKEYRSNYKLKEYAKLIEILNDASIGLDKDFKEQYLNSLLKVQSYKQKRYILPFIFEVCYKKTNTCKSLGLIIIGIKALEFINFMHEPNINSIKQVRCFNMTLFSSKK